MDPKSAKQEFIEIMQRMPDDASMEELLPRMGYVLSILRGLEEARRGEGITQEELEARLRDSRTSTGRRRLADP